MGDFGPNRDKWVCPNDRELSLRAKLRTGWSVKTGSLSSFGKPEQLNDLEQEAIMSVIRKAEQLERVEQERVGRLVERLENMKRNAMGNGTTQCILCADEFGLLGASPLLCNDCKKAVCTKCGVDTFSAQREPLWLCKICAETREMWKKSGAWFFKSLPKYVLPEKKTETNKYGPGARFRANESNLGYSGTGRTYGTWCQGKRGADLQEHESTDSSDEDAMKLGRNSQKQMGRKTFSDSVESNESSASGRNPPSGASSSALQPSASHSPTQTPAPSTSPNRHYGASYRSINEASYEESHVDYSDSERYSEGTGTPGTPRHTYHSPHQEYRDSPYRSPMQDSFEHGSYSPRQGSNVSPAGHWQNRARRSDEVEEDDEDVDRAFQPYTRQDSQRSVTSSTSVESGSVRSRQASPYQFNRSLSRDRDSTVDCEAASFDDRSPDDTSKRVKRRSILRKMHKSLMKKIHHR